MDVCLFVFIFVLFCFFPVISTNIHYCLNNIFHNFKALKKVIETKMFNADFHN